MSGSAPPWRTLARRLGRLGIAAILIATTTALLLEGGARLLAESLGISPYMQYDEALGWTARPGVVKRHRDRDGQFDVTYRFNEHGFRGPAYPRSKPAGTTRIVLLGDSTGFGWGVADDDTVAAILDRELENVEVVNLSLSGYGIDQSYLRFLHTGLSFEPDLVILQVSHNDFEEIMHPFFNQKPKPHFVANSGGELRLANVPVRPTGERMKAFYANSLPVPFKEWLGWNSYAFNLVNEFYYGLRRRSQGNVAPARDIYTPESIVLFNRIAALLDTQIRAAGARGIIVFSAKAVSAQRHVAEGHMEALDLYPAFLQAGAGDDARCYFADGYHWNRLGHRIAADALIDAISAREN